MFFESAFKRMFSPLYVIGIGGFGRVWKVENKKTNSIFAMKEMSKAL
jgi:serum/glucocorticoid-regulated kinase 2